MGNAVLLNGCQRLFGVEAFHHHRGAAHGLNEPAEPQRRSMINRRRRQVYGLGIESVEMREQHCEGIRLIDLPVRERNLDSLGAAGRARGVQHVRPGGLRGQRLVGGAVERVFIRVVAVHVTAERQPQRDRRSVVEDRLGLFAHTRGDDERRGAGIVDDVAHLCGRQMMVDRRDVQPRPQCSPIHDEDLGNVVAEQRHVIALA
ncbi:Uncharacterised protein [Mycobacteroides abscessus subsp. massiliense]|nr:Uncharacterised protein [Mycobacteroides abscessus subsp. massiliense]